jgi:hypothetical protein
LLLELLEQSLNLHSEKIWLFDDLIKLGLSFHVQF